MMNKPLTRRVFLKSTALSAGAALLRTAASADGADAAEIGEGPGMAQLKVPHPTRFRILQFTDLHLFAGEKMFHNAVNKRTNGIIRHPKN